jgi:DNA-binding transcriptional LysR family regulator
LQSQNPSRFLNLLLDDRLNAGIDQQSNASDAASFEVIPDAMARFRSAYPDVEVWLSELNSDEGLEAVRTRQLDLCVLHPPRIVDPDLNIETIWLEPLVVVLPQKHRLADLQRISLGRLKSEPWVFWRREFASRLYDEVIAACTAAGFEPRVVQRTRRATTTVSMVASGIGVALLPITSARLRIGGAIYRHIRSPSISVPVAFAWRQDRADPLWANLMAVVRDSARRRKGRN